VILLKKTFNQGIGMQTKSRFGIILCIVVACAMLALIVLAVISFTTTEMLQSILYYIGLTASPVLPYILLKSAAARRAQNYIKIFGVK
jgi:hypothetical protein